LYDELNELNNILLKNPKTGIDYGNNVYKIKLASKSKNTGKSGGFRIITYLIQETKTSIEVNLITIFDKSEESNITKEEILKIITKIFS